MSDGMEVSGETIRRARESMGMTAVQLAGRLKVTPQAVTAWERGENSPRGRYLTQLREILSPGLRKTQTPLMRPVTGLKALRERAGLSRAALADKSGVSESAIINYETGYRSPEHLGLGTALRLAAALGMTDVRALMPRADAVSAHVTVDSRSKADFAARCDAVGLTGSVLARALDVKSATTAGWRNPVLQANVPDRAWGLLALEEESQSSLVRDCVTEATDWSKRHSRAAGVASLVYWRGEHDYADTGLPGMLDWRVADASMRACASALRLMGWGVQWEYPEARPGVLWRFCE